MNEFDYLAKAKSKMEDKKYYEVISLCDKALEINPDLHQAYNFRGDANFALSEFKEAVKDYSNGIELAPYNADYYYDRSWAYSNIDDEASAILDINKALDIKPNSSLFLYTKASFELYDGRYREGIFDCTKAIELNPTANKYIIRADCYMELEEYNLALADLNHALEINPESAWAYSRRGILYKKLERLQDAEKDFKKTVELRPDDDYALAELGYIRINLGKKDGMSYFNKAIKVNPCPINYYKRVIARAEILKKEDFIKNLAENKTVWYDNSENMIFNEKQAKDDIKDLNKALALDSADTYCLRLRVTRYNYLKQYQNALEDCETLIALEPDNETWLLASGYAKFNTDDFQGAIETIDAVLEINDGIGDDFMFWTRGLACCKLGDLKNAVRDFTKGLAYKETDNLYFDRGLANYRLRRFLKAYQDLKKALELNPNIEAETGCKIPKLIKFVLGLSFAKPQNETLIGLCDIEKI